MNDNAQRWRILSNALFDAGVMPYYLHVLDKVQGAAHFMVTDDEARQIMRELLTLVSGYMVPRNWRVKSAANRAKHRWIYSFVSANPRGRRQGH